jgi:hypothetical protein
MSFIGKILIVVGAIMVLYAFNMRVALEGSEVVNMHLLSNRQNITIFGSILLLAGVVLFATNRTRTKEENDDVIDTFAKNKASDINENIKRESANIKTKLRNIMTGKKEGIKISTENIRFNNIHFKNNRPILIIIISFIVMIISFFFPREGYDYGNRIGYFDLTFGDVSGLLLFNSYLIASLLLRIPIYYKYAIIGSALSALSSFNGLRGSYSFANFSKEHVVGSGLWVVLVATIINLFGVLLIKMMHKDKAILSPSSNNPSQNSGPNKTIDFLEIDDQNRVRCPICNNGTRLRQTDLDSNSFECPKCKKTIFFSRINRGC